MVGNPEIRVDRYVSEYCLCRYSAIFLEKLFPAKLRATLLFGPFKVCQKNPVFAVFAILQNLRLVKKIWRCSGIHEMLGDIYIYIYIFL